MDRFEGHCWLEWWANSSTLLCSAEVAVVIESAGDGWKATGRLAGLDEAEREGFDFVCELDPVFTLRFGDDSTIPVAVEGPDRDGRLVMTEYTFSRGGRELRPRGPGGRGWCRGCRLPGRGADGP
jgi:hypothetical protein